MQRPPRRERSERFLLPFGLGTLASATGNFAAGFAVFANVAGLMALAVAGRDRKWTVSSRVREVAAA